MNRQNRPEDGADGSERESRPEHSAPDGLYETLFRKDPSGALLTWLARHAGGTAMLIRPDGTLARIVPEGPPPRELDDARQDIRRVLTGKCATARIAKDGWQTVITGSRGGPAVMVLARTDPATGEPGTLTLQDMARAAELARISWLARDRDIAVYQLRQAVLQLLMARQIQGARKLAASAHPPLGELVRVCLVEDTADDLATVAAACELACEGRAWIAPCSVYDRRLVILYPAERQDSPAGPVLDALRHACPDAAISAGNIVSLDDTAAGYRQASYAMAVARHRPDRTALYTAVGDLSGVLGPEGGEWARRRLNPLTSHEPSRRTNPGGAELAETLEAWLDFGPGAAQHLKIHRNTLYARLRLIATLLDVSLDSLRTQAELHLALQARHIPAPDGTAAPEDLDVLLDQDAARDWARAALAPLAGSENEPLLKALRAWLASDASPPAAAARLGIREKALRERLKRAEQRLGQSLTSGPSARFDLYLALHLTSSLPLRSAQATPRGQTTIMPDEY